MIQTSLECYTVIIFYSFWYGTYTEYRSLHQLQNPYQHINMIGGLEWGEGGGWNAKSIDFLIYKHATET